MQAPRDENFVPAMLFVGSDGETYPVEGDEATGRLFVDVAGGSGTVTSVSVVSANGLAGTVATATTTPAITLSTTITGILKGNGTAISAITVGSGLSYDGTTLSATASGGGNVSNTGTPANNQIAIWTDATTIEGDSALTFDTSTNNMILSGQLGIGGTPSEILHLIKPTTEFTTMQFDSGTTQGYMFAYDGDNTVNIGSKSNAQLNFKVNNANAATLTATALSVGTSSATGIVQSNGNQDLILQTGNATTGTVTIADGANGNITIAPNGTGDVVIGNGVSVNVLRPNGDGNSDLGDSTNFFENLYLNASIIKNDIEISSTNGVLEVDYADNTANGAGLELIHRSVSPAANDVVGSVYFTGFDTSVALQRYAQITGVITDTTSTSEDGKLTFGVVTAGTLANELELTGAALYPTTNNGLDLGTSSLAFNAAYATTIELGAASDTTISRSAAGVISVEGVVIPSISSTNTLTNKRVTPRTGTTTSSATPTINTDNVDFYSITAQTVDITSFTTNLSGTPTDGQKLWIAITGTAARAITWGASFEASTVALPTTTVTTNRLDVGFVWNSVTSKWRCVASA
jgi:hypothetical protein